MDATLDTLHGIEKSLQGPLPAPPSWNLISSDVEAQVCLQYPTFTNSQQPQIQIKIDSLHNKNLLAQLTNDPKYGFFPPFKFTLIRAVDSFYETLPPAWSKGDWVWAPKFNCRQIDRKTKSLKNMSIRIDTPLGKKTKKVSEFQVLFQARESLYELRNHLWAEFGKLLQEKSESYETFLKYCGLAQLHYVNKQKKKIEAQMADIYESWITSFPTGVSS